MARKQSKLLTIEPWISGMCTAVFPYNEQVNRWLAAHPGVRFGSHIKRGAWLIPEELYPKLITFGRKFGWKPVLRDLPRKETPIANRHLYPFQRPVVEKMVAHRSQLLILETGLGKCLCSIATFEALKPGRIFIVCPAIVRRHWRDEFLKWWGQTSMEETPGQWQIFLVESGKDAKELDLPSKYIVITSYELCHHFVHSDFDAVVIDEAHYIQDARRKRSKAARKILWRNHESLKFGLTATPISVNPKGLHNQLHALWANRFGDFWDFARRYIDIGENEHTKWLFGGWRDEYIKEIKSRLDYCTVRKAKTDADVAPHLPNNIVQPLRVPAPAKMNVRELLENFSRPDQHTAKARESMLRATGSTKIKHAVELALTEIEGNNHVCVGAYYHDTAKEIAAAIERKTDVPVFYVDGDIPVPKRNDILDAAKHSHRAVLVATMESVNVGISLTFNQVAVTAELYPSPLTMEQWMGRFDRLDTDIPSKVILMILEGTQDEAIAYVIQKRLRDQKRVIRQSRAGKALEEATTESEEDFLSAIADAANQMREEDEYY